MVEILSECWPVARKEHTCDYCRCKIEKGTKYYKQTLKYEDTIYDWKCHGECKDLTSDLDMWDNADDGVGPYEFGDCVNEFLLDRYYDEALDDIREDVDRLSRFEQVMLIYKDWDSPETKLWRMKHDFNQRRWNGPRYKKDGTRETPVEWKARIDAEWAEIERFAESIKANK